MNSTAAQTPGPEARLHELGRVRRAVRLGAPLNSTPDFAHRTRVINA